ncbi:hypothetical protein CspeluHIS016_0600210 [Cutaneotrichosporon spelunceum]|uniref:cAMP-dependent protein kinase regulatory subunit n=1 Tax=Cutaneotrichosporon spelunceum TaxID=1672016 RepID=A0AAD3TY06_9TREE|nr:hypothetical protein CspeluHIS016_0600210 [Cutaneotrichosporon spelunceum]
MSGASAQYQNILNNLNKDVARQQPSDIFQFCADWFQDKLRDQRASSSTGGVANFAKGPGETSPRSELLDPTDRGSNPGIGAAAMGGAAFGGGAAAAGLFASSFGGRDVPDRAANDSPFGEPTDKNFNSNSPFGPGAQTPSAPVGVPRPPSPEGEDDDDDDSDDEAPPIPQYALGRRTSVSAESLQPSHHSRRYDPGANAFIEEDDEDDASSANAIPSFPKTPEQIERIRFAIKDNFLFKNLDEEQEMDVLTAMREVTIPAKETIIQQGDAGDYFYIVEDGELEVFVKKDGQTLDLSAGDSETLGKRVVVYHEGASFGELALMHNAPRAATIVSTTPCTLWALDRVSFRTILLDHTSRRRREYEAFLAAVPILSSLKAGERAKIADVLESRSFEAKQDIIREGELGDEFFLIESGAAEALKVIDGVETVVKQMVKGDYFGELALLNRQTRAATVRASEKIRVAALGEQAFTRLLGPAKDIMARTAGERYGW